MSTFPYNVLTNELDTFTTADLIAQMGSTERTLYGPPPFSWASQAFFARGRVAHGSSCPSAFLAGMTAVDSSGMPLCQDMYWNAFAPWVVAIAESDNTCTNAYVKISKIRCYILSLRTGLWTRFGSQGNGYPSGGLTKYKYDYSTSYGGATVIYDVDGAPCFYPWHTVGPEQIMLHSSIMAKGEIDGEDYGGCFVVCESQLVPPIGAAFDATPRYALSVGADLYPDINTSVNTGVIAGQTYVPGVGGSAFRSIPTDGSPRLHYFITTNNAAITTTNGTSVHEDVNGAASLYMSNAELAANMPALTPNLSIVAAAYQALWGFEEVTNHGPLPFVPTPLARGTMFVATDGSAASPGTDENAPTTIQEAFDNAGPDDVVFLREGNYYVYGANLNMWAEGTVGHPIIFEPYPGDGDVVINGVQMVPNVDTVYKCNISGRYQVFRNIKWKYFPEYGAFVSGTRNLFENCEASYNKLSGFFTYVSGSAPWTSASYNGFKSCWAHHNSDVGLTGGNWDDGGNADGFALSRGIGNWTSHCLSEYNSDDGFDAWISEDTGSEFDISRYNGAGPNGNGNGGKFGGNTEGSGCRVRYFLTYGNLGNGADFNTGIGVEFQSITAYDNGGVGIVLGADTVVTRSVSSGNGTQVSGTGIPSGNSWDLVGTLAFVSPDPDSPDFLKVVQDGVFNGIGHRYI